MRNRKKIATFVMKKKIYYIVVDMKKLSLNEIEYMEGGFLFVSIVSRILKKKYKKFYQYGGTWKSKKK